MAKRLADTDKYKKKFIKELPVAYKLLWDYICLECNHAGIWEVEFDIAQSRLGEDITLDQNRAIELFNKDEKRIVVLNSGSKWFIRPFIDFQYGKLNPMNKVHASVINLLAKEGIKPLASPLHEAKDIAIAIVKDKDKDIRGFSFEEIYSKYPNKDGRKQAELHFKASVKTDKDWQDIQTALKNYLASDKVTKGFIKMASTWFNNWRDWVNFKDIKPGSDPSIPEHFQTCLKEKK
jgi:hypothetical protein